MADSHETSNMHPHLNVPLNDQQHFRLNKISEVKDYFNAEIKERKLMCNRVTDFVNILLLLTILTSR